MIGILIRFAGFSSFLTFDKYSNYQIHWKDYFCPYKVHTKVFLFTAQWGEKTENRLCTMDSKASPSVVARWYFWCLRTTFGATFVSQKDVPGIAAHLSRTRVRWVSPRKKCIKLPSPFTDFISSPSNCVNSFLRIAYFVPNTYKSMHTRGLPIINFFDKNRKRIVR